VSPWRDDLLRPARRAGAHGDMDGHGVFQGRPSDDGLRPATFAPGDYGRVVRPDGSETWWVRTPERGWVLLARHRVTRNDDGTITVSPLR